MSDWVTAQKEELRSDILKLILYELNTAVCPREHRIAALQAGIDEFNHTNPTKHDQELELHADKILFQKLSYSFITHKHHEELGMVCSALEMIYRANRSRVALSFQEIGDCILPLFVEIMRWSAARRRDIWKKQQQQRQRQQQQRQQQQQTTFNNQGQSDSSSLTSTTIIRPQPSSETPLRSNRSFSPYISQFNGTTKLPDKLPEDREFTIEIITNGTGTTDFSNGHPPPSPLKGHHMNNHEVMTVMEQTESKLISRPATHPTSSLAPQHPGVGAIAANMTNSEVLENSTASTSDDSESNNVTSPEQLKPPRQVRFSDAIEHHQVVIDHSGMLGGGGGGGGSNTSGMSSSISNSETVHIELEQRSRLSREKFAHPLALLKILKILRYFSRVLSAMVPMAHFPGLLDELIFQMKIRKGAEGTEGILRTGRRSSSQEDDMNSYQNPRMNDGENGSGYGSSTTPAVRRTSSTYLDNASAARMDAIATVVNLACAEENKSKLLNHPGLLDAVIGVADADTIDDAREHSSIVIMNLALAEENKLEMANRGNLLSIIMKLMTDKVTNTRRYASATFLTLVGVPENTNRIAKFRKGKLLHDLMNVLANDKVEEIRINIAEGLFNFVRNSNEQETIELIGCHRSALKGLTSTVLTDYSADVRAYAARTLEWLAADIHYGSKSHAKLLDALIESSMWTKTTCIVEALKAQATIEENRRAMVETPGMLDTLASLASLHGVNDEEVRECALAAIERLTCERSTRKTMAMHEGIMMELTRATFSSNGIMDQFEENDKLTRSLMKSALKNLAEEI